LPGAPSSPHYIPGVACGSESSLKVVEGISVGWGDTYGANLGYQWIKINGLADGKYRVQVIADPGNKFLESSNSNNTNSAYIKISGNTVSLVSPSA
jgi:Lysyl oxidase